MLKNPFIQVKDKFKILPHISSNNAKDEVAKKLLKTYLGYWGTFILWLIVSYNFIPMVFSLVALMWCIGGITSIKIQPEAANISKNTRIVVLSYILGLMAWRMIIGMIINTPIELWEKAFMMDLNPAFANTFIGFVSTSFIITMFMGFIGYLNYIFQLFKFHNTSKGTKEYMSTLMRKGEDK